MIIPEKQRKELDAYIMALEEFCALSINDRIGTFWKIAKKPHLVAEWRKRTAIDLYQREFHSRKYPPKQDPGIILSLSGYFQGPLSDDDSNTNYCINNSRDNWNDTIRDIDHQICKVLSSELCDPESVRSLHLTDKQRMDAVAELQKPLKY